MLPRSVSEDALGVLPRTLADAVTGIDGTALGRPVAAQIGVPRLAARAHGRCQLLAMGVGASEAAEIATLAGPGAGHEKRHVGRLRDLLGAGGRPERHKRSGGQNGYMQLGSHGVSSGFDAARFDDAGSIGSCPYRPDHNTASRISLAIGSLATQLLERGPIARANLHPSLNLTAPRL